jgi:hypothetical protein
LNGFEIEREEKFGVLLLLLKEIKERRLMEGRGFGGLLNQLSKKLLLKLIEAILVRNFWWGF